MDTKDWRHRENRIDRRHYIASYTQPGSARIHESSNGEVFLRDRGVARVQFKLFASIPLASVGAWLVLQELLTYSRSPSVEFLVGGSALLALSAVLVLLVTRSAARYRDLVFDPMGKSSKFIVRTGSWLSNAQPAQMTSDTLSYCIHELTLSSITVNGVDCSWKGYAAIIYCGDGYLTVAMKLDLKDLNHQLQQLPKAFRSSHWPMGASICCNPIFGVSREY